MEKAPDGYFWNGVIWYDTGRDDEALVAKGFELQIPDLAGASNAALNEAHTRLATLLYSLPAGYHMQVQWTVDSNYADELNRYREDTGKSDNRWTQYIRNERFFRHKIQMESGFLRRQRLVVFFSRKVPTSLSRFFTTESAVVEKLNQLVEQEGQAFENLRATMQQALGSTSKVVSLGDEEHFLMYRAFLNPSLRYRGRSGLHEFDASGSIQELCWRSDGVPQEEASFRFDDTFHSIFVITRWPQFVEPGKIQWLTRLPFNDYAITCNLYPLDVKAEIRKEEKMIERLAGEIQSEGRYTLVGAKAKKERKVDELGSGYTQPFNALYVVRVWASSLEELIMRSSTVKQAIADMGAQYYHVTRPVTARNLFFQTWPGWTGGKYRGWDVYSNNHVLADLLPFNSTFVGHLAVAEAIYDGADQNLVGIRTFAGNTPNHAVVFGSTGSGKSAFLTDLLTQTEPYYANGLTVLIEEGFSYGVYTQTQGQTPIVLQPDGELTLNYFDTQTLPLTRLQLSNASALCLRMVGLSSGEDTNKLRLAQLSHYIHQLYTDAAHDWAAMNEEFMPSIKRRAFILERYRRERMPIGATFVDAFTEFRDWETSTSNGEAQEYLAKVDEGELLAWSKGREGEQIIQDLIFSYFKPAEFPQHRALCEIMAHARHSTHEAKEINHMATMLTTWTAQEGQRGKLFDGVTNVDLASHLLHFELSRIPQSANDLKEAAGFLINNTVRNKIMTMPRNVRKRVVFEEVARFMDMPGGAEIVAAGYATYRKYGTWLVSVVQQYAQYKTSSIRPVIMGNSKQFFILNQTDTDDLNDIGDSLNLPDVTVEAIRSYPSPEHLPKGQRYSSATYFALDGPKPVNGTFRNCACPEMLLCSSTDGDTFEKRSKQLRTYPDVVTGLLDLANDAQLQA